MADPLPVDPVTAGAAARSITSAGISVQPAPTDVSGSGLIETAGPRSPVARPLTGENAVRLRAGAAPGRMSGEAGVLPADGPAAKPENPTIAPTPLPADSPDPLSGQMLMLTPQAAPAPDRFQPPVTLSPPVPFSAPDVARQMVQALPQGLVADAAPVELVLSPAELGTVRMVFHTSGDSVSLTVRSDRAETHEMLRRHSDLLAEELRGSGFTNVSFDFGQQRRHPPPPPQPLPAVAVLAFGTARPPVAGPDLPRPQPVHAGSGLDLRL